MGISGLGREGGDTPTRDVNAANTVKFRTAPQIAQRAADLVGGDRDREHGKKKQNFDNIAAMWNGYLAIRRSPDKPLDAVDVGHMMVAMKIARTQSGALNVDDYVDAAGYAACAGEVAIGLEAMPYSGDRGDETPEKPKFKVGDRVRPTFTTLTDWGVGEIVESKDGSVRVDWPDGRLWWHDSNRFALAPAKFKVGDRVRCACDSCREDTWRHPIGGVVCDIAEPWLRLTSKDVLGGITAILISDAELAP